MFILKNKKIITKKKNNKNLFKKIKKSKSILQK